MKEVTYSYKCNYCRKPIEGDPYAVRLCRVDRNENIWKDSVNVPGIDAFELHYHEECIAALLTSVFKEEEKKPEEPLRPTLKSPSPAPRKGTRDVKESIKRLWNEGCSQTEICNTVRRDSSTVSYYMKTFRSKYGDEAVDNRSIPYEDA